MKGEKLRMTEDGELVPVLNDRGQELPDPTPMAPPVGFIKQRPLHERIRAMVQHEFLRRKQEEDVESPEEADDFVIDDEDDARHGERFAMLPGHEHDWEENYEPPKDFKDMKERLVAAGWTPPQSDVEGKAVAAADAAGPQSAAGPAAAAAVKPVTSKP